MLRLSIAAIGAALVLALSMACGGDGASGRVQVEWRTQTEGAPAATGGEPLPTTVYVTNATGETVRNAVLRFDPTVSRGGHAGLSIGTVTNVSSRQEGRAQVWELGDLPANTRVVFNIGLWFDSALNVSGETAIDLVLELASEDLADAVTSNRLQVDLAHRRP